jgi:hypothetical protein
MSDTKKKRLHERRGVSFAEIGALLGTRNLIAAGLLEARTATNFYEPGAHLFDIRVSCRNNDNCGTVSCIGGTMALIMGMDADAARGYVGTRGHSESLQELFYPDIFYEDDGERAWDKVTPAVAVKAIDNWLNTGDPAYHTLVDGVVKKKNEL